MTKNDGICRILFEQMKIGAADAGGLQLDNHAVAAAFRHLDVHDLNGVLFRQHGGFAGLILKSSKTL